MSNYVKREDLLIYDNVNGHISEKEYNTYEDTNQKIEQISYNGKPYWRKTEKKKKPLFRKHVHFSPIKHTIRERKINRSLTPYYPKKRISLKQGKKSKNNRKKQEQKKQEQKKQEQKKQEKDKQK